jgi:hypothetical protein
VNKTFAALFAAAALAVATVAIAAAVPGPVSLPAKPGNVTFNHDTHKALACTACHPDATGGPIAGIGKQIDKDKAHALCLDCHKKEAKGPTKCAECHKKG